MGLMVPYMDTLDKFGYMKQLLARNFQILFMDTEYANFLIRYNHLIRKEKVVIPYAIELKSFEFRRARSYLRSGAIYSLGRFIARVH